MTNSQTKRATKVRKARSKSSQLSLAEKHLLIEFIQQGGTLEAFPQALQDHVELQKTDLGDRAQPSGPSDKIRQIFRQLSRLDRHAAYAARQIELCQQGLSLVSREENAEQWGQLQLGLGDGLMNSPLGDRAANLKASIEAFNSALEVFTRRNFPEQWAGTQNNLANAYSERTDGDLAVNIEAAIKAFNSALEVFTPYSHSEDWAMVQSNLGIAYSRRRQGDRAMNIEYAIDAYESALKIYTRVDYSNDWAMVQNNLSIAYSQRKLGDRAMNTERAIRAAKSALEIYTQSHFPNAWAGAQVNLGAAYSRRKKGDSTQNVERSIHAYTQALKVRTKSDYPFEWASIQNDLGIAYSQRKKGDRASNVEAAITAFNHSLEVLTPQTYAQHYRNTTKLIADLYSDTQRWEEAARAYEVARDAAETIYQSATFANSRSYELGETSDLYFRAAYAHAQTDDLERAVVLLEQGRARGLRETIERDRTALLDIENQSPALYADYQNTVQQIQTLNATQGSAERCDRPHDSFDLCLQAPKLQSEREEIIKRIRQLPGHENFLAPPTFAAIEASLTPACPLVYIATTRSGSLALVVHKLSDAHTKVTKVLVDDLTNADLRILINSKQKSALFGAYNNFRRSPDQNFSAWGEALNTCLQALRKSITQPLMVTLQAQSITRATLIPCGLLGLLPIHATTDAVQFTYAPSALALATARREATQTRPMSLLAIDNPTQDLSSSKQEVAMATAQFAQAHTLTHHQATRHAVLSALPNYSVVHFSCHGVADTNAPMKSHLKLADNEGVTLRDFLNVSLSGTHLAILSACETGLSGTELPDEVISLPTSLLQAGVAGIISTLWSVSDFSTALLLTKFYDLWRNENDEPAVALHHAQRWLRDSTAKQMLKYIGASLSGNGPIPRSTANEFFNQLSCSDDSEQHPFSHPHYWAAFTYTGA